MWRHRISAQQIVKIDILNLGNARASSDQLIDLWNRAHVNRQAHQGCNNFPAPFWRYGRDCQQHLGDIVLINELFHILRLAHLQAIDDRVLHAWIIIDEDHHAVLVTVMQGCQQLPARLASTVDDDILGH